MSDIVLVTFNAKYIHAAFGLRYLKANLGSLSGGARIMEFVTSQRPLEALEAILAESPRVVGIGVYIWNVRQSEALVSLLKRVRPDIQVVLGGPEVSHEAEDQPMCQEADYVIQGEGEEAFRGLCERLLRGERPEPRVVSAPLPEIGELVMPYDLYEADDISHRVIYVEASRGCPFRCEFCLSSLDKSVRQFPLEAFLGQMQSLLDRGLRHFKFVDRTFNLDLKASGAILAFFLERFEPGMFLHFEMIPDRLPEGLREIIARFPAGALQFEVGIQTFDEDTARRISRRQRYDKLRENLRFLREQTGVHVHADLIAGLPGESLESFAEGFDALVEMGPQEIQVGILKRLRGTPIVRHTQSCEMIYSPQPPYEILSTASVGFEALQDIRRFAGCWDRVANSGNFQKTTPMIWGTGSPFEGFMAWTKWLHARIGRTHSVALLRLMAQLFAYLTEVVEHDPAAVSLSMLEDYRKGGRNDVPTFLRPHLSEGDLVSLKARVAGLPSRQARHL